MQRPQNSQRLGRPSSDCQPLGSRGTGQDRVGIAPQYRQPKSQSRLNWFFIHQLLVDGGARGAKKHGGEAVSVEEKRRRLEAAIFLSPEGESSRKLAKLAGLADATEARTLIRQINQELDAQGRAYRIEEVAGGYAMMTRSHFAPWLRRLPHVPGAIKLSQSALETLAVVAYRQPVLRANVEAIRGVTCSEVLKQLMELDLVRISGRSEDLGRPYLYGTTRRFLQMFGLRSADRLPRIAWVNQDPNPSPTPPPADLDSESKESTVKKSFTAAALLERNAQNVDESLLEQPAFVPSAIDDDEDDFDDDDDDDFDDDDDWDDDDEDDDELDDDDDEEEVDELDDDAEWEEVDDDEEPDDDDEEEVEGEDDEDEDEEWDDDDDDDEDDDDDDDWD